MSGVMKTRRRVRFKSAGPRGRRLLAWGAGLLLVVSAGLWMARHAIGNALLDDALAAVGGRIRPLGIELTDLRSGRLEIPSPVRARVPAFRSEFDLGKANRNRLRSQFDADELEARLAGVFPPKVRLSAKGFSVKFHPEDVPEGFPFDGFYDGEFRSSPLPATDPKAAMGLVLERIRALFDENRVDSDFDLSGDVRLDLGPHGVATARLRTEVLDGGARRLVFLEKDLRRIAGQAKVELADDEIGIVSLYPMRVPAIILVTTRAKSESTARKQLDPGFPDDAWRHVTWSYHLTKVFGPDFAKEVTDAHETLPNNTPEERAMDYHNNAIGRELAGDGTSAQALDAIVLGDARVIRHPDEVPGRDGLLR